jgi:hypothetical protein
MNLTQQDAQLLSTQFDEETEKLAEAKANSIQEAYLYGLEKIAKEVADERDEEDKKEESKKEEKMDEESEKAAAELGAFIERGFFDGLRKLGSERHGDEGFYLEPFITSKLAAEVSESTKKDPHYIRRILLGNSLSAGIAAPWGRKMEAMGQARGHSSGEALVGGAGGAVAGGAIGALGGLGHALATKGLKGKGALAGAALGAGAGGLLGSAIGGIHGDLGARGTQIHREAYDKK